MSHQEHREQFVRDSQDQAVRMTRSDLTDLVVALLHHVIGPRMTCTMLPAHATATAVVVVTDVIVAWPLHYHNRR
jgi:hypothetical protein